MLGEWPTPEMSLRGIRSQHYANPHANGQSGVTAVLAPAARVEPEAGYRLGFQNRPHSDVIVTLGLTMSVWWDPQAMGLVGFPGA